MLLQAVSRYWILCGMAGIFSIGVLSRMWLSHMIRGLLKDTKNMGTPKKKLLKQMKLRYESCYRLNGGINNMEAFVTKNLYGYRFLGMTLDGVQKISGQALFFSLLLGGLTGIYSYYMELPDMVTGTYLASGLAFAIGLLYVNCVFDAPRKEMLLEAGVIDYLENYLAGQMDRQIQEEAEGVQQLHAVQEDASVLTADRKGIIKKRKEHFSNKKLASDMEYLKQSLNQIAAELERKQDVKDYVSTKEDEKIIEEVLCEYLG